MLPLKLSLSPLLCGAGKRFPPAQCAVWSAGTPGVKALVAAVCVLAAAAPAQQVAKTPVPPRVAAAQQFLAARGWKPGYQLTVRHNSVPGRRIVSMGQGPATPTWQPLGPAAVSTPAYGLVTGRISAVALDPSDATGNRLYVGTTGGGVWAASNAGTANASSIVFTPLTDTAYALGGAADASISIGALTVQPGGTGVILAGTGDPNDLLDSYYGAGILRSTDGGTTWALIPETRDAEDGLSGQDFAFTGEGFAGFAWSTVNPQLVVAAVSQAYQGTLVDADQSNLSYEGLYYSTDSGATWHLAKITDGSGHDVQGPLNAFDQPDGNAVTAVVWNPVRQVFVAAVRYHGYYQSTDGVTWTRLAAQPGAGLTAAACPANPGTTGSITCPIFRGTLAVNPVTGDTFAWTVDLNNQDQGLWQDQCGLSNGACGNGAIAFSKQWSTAALESNTIEGAATIANGNYNLALAAVPSQQDTLLLAGANDLWKCSLAAGCVWRNTTNATTCMSAQVGGFQHAITWNTANPLEIFAGNDSGLWRSMDAIGETGPACSSSDASHFQNLNGGLGSLAEVVSMSASTDSPDAMMAGLGVNGTAGARSAAATADWPQILAGYGGPVAIDSADNDNWYVNNAPGVSIFKCSQSSLCTPADFGASPVVTDADVNLPAGAMAEPAPFLVDPLDAAQLLVGTCQLWRGPADGSAWTASNAVTPVLDSGEQSARCKGEALIRSMSAQALPGGGEVIYLGMDGAADGGAQLAGHVLSVTLSQSAAPVVTDLSSNPVINDTNPFNGYGLDVSSVYADPHDATGQTVYVTVAGMANPKQVLRTIYRSTDGGAHWTVLTSNLPVAPANSVIVDPQNVSTVYLATDLGVYFTTNVASCGQPASACWSLFGAGLPEAPVVALSTVAGNAPALIAATYGRGIWQAPLSGASAGLTAVTPNPATLSFGNQTVGTASAEQTITLNNTGILALTVTSIAVSGAFSEIDNCVNAAVPAGGSCAIQVAFAPTATGAQTGQVVVQGNVPGGQMTVDLDGTGTAAGAVSVAPQIVSFGSIRAGSTSAMLPLSVTNTTGATVPITSVVVTGPFVIAGNACGTISLSANAACQIELEFKPTQAGPATGTFVLTDGAGIQSVELTGVGLAAPTDTLSPASLTFPATATGQLSAAQNLTITNAGGQPLTSIAVSVSSGFTITNECTTQLAANSSCTIGVQFAPAHQGSISGTLTVTDALRQQTVSLSGTAVAPAAISVNPGSLTFTNQQPGIASAPQVVTVTNSGGAPMANVGFQITGPAAASYSIQSTTCGAVLNSGANCTAQIVFTPAGTGAIAAALAVSSSTTGVAPAQVPLNGSGQLASGFGTNPAQLSFTAVVGVGQSSAAQTLTVTNSTSYAIGSVALAVTAPFQLAQNNCTGALAAGANCSAAVVFAPTAAGVATGALTISSAVVANPATVSLTGTGFDFALSPSGAASVTVSSGQTAHFTLVITPNGSSGVFAFACGSLPANAECAFNPPSETLSTGVQGNVTVQIATGQGNATASSTDSAGWRTAPLVCGVILLPLALACRRRGLLLVVLAMVLAAGISSCTSSSGGTGGEPLGGSESTPAGTYTIPVTISSTGVSHVINVTLTVD
ncbi:MAG TPA: choice-of-anchor D domain-containing protein [Terracidiphilus sp.]|nr:choice-of-anchor D domain-containing protein [Terracidiphilus sp.]